MLYAPQQIGQSERSGKASGPPACQSFKNLVFNLSLCAQHYIMHMHRTISHYYHLLHQLMTSTTIMNSI